MKDRKNRKSSVLPADETAMFCTQIAFSAKIRHSLADGTRLFTAVVKMAGK